MPDPAFSRFGKYQIQAELGRGGFGRVFRAFDPTVGRLVAIKILISEAGTDLLTRFRNEAMAAGKLRHENIVTIYEFGEDKGVPFIVMEYLEGEDLQQALSSGKPLTLLDKVSVMTQAAAGLDCAHRHGVVHRDIKPANIRLLPDGTVKLMDFGIARLIRDAGGARLTRQGHVLGTLLYMAPEQVMGSDTDALCDIFAFGVTFYELLTGRHPFQAEDPRSVFYKITSEDPELIHHLAPECPETLDHVLRRALQKDRELRYQSLHDLRVDVEPVLIELRKERAATLVAEAHRLVSEGNFDVARPLLNQAIDLDPANHNSRSLRDTVQGELRRRLLRPRIDTLLTKADELVAEGNYADAVQTLETALRLDPGDAALQTRSREAQEHRDRSRESNRLLADARADLAQGSLAEALQKASDAVALNPKNTDARSLLEIVELGISERERQQRLQAGLSAARELLDRAQFIDAVQMLQRLRPEFPGEPGVDQLLSDAQQALASSERAQAIENLQAEVLACVEAKRFEDALRLLASCINDDPGEPAILRLRDTVLEAKRAWDREQGVGQTVARCDALADQNQFEEALAALEEALQEYPDDAVLAHAREALAAKQRATLLQQLEREVHLHLEEYEFEQALELLHGASGKLSGEPALARLQEAALSAKAAWERDEAIAAEERDALALRAERQSALQQAAQQCADLIRAGSLAEAGRTLQNAIRDFPGEPELLAIQQRLRAEWDRQRRSEATRRAAGNARALLDRGQSARAVELLEAAAAQYPDDPVVENALANARLALGEQRKAQVVETVCRETRVYLNNNDFDRALKTVEVNLETLSGEQRLVELRATVIAARRDFERSMPGEPAASTGARAVTLRAPVIALTPEPNVSHPLPLEATPLVVEPAAPSPPAPARPRKFRKMAFAGAGFALAFAAVLIGLQARRPAPATTALAVETEPPGAVVRIGGRSCTTPDCRLELPAGDYRVDARLPGYAAASEPVSIRKGANAHVRLSLVPLPTSLAVTSNFASGNVYLDGKSVGQLTGGQLRLAEIQPGPHRLRIASPDGEALLSFIAARAGLPELHNEISARDTNAIAITSLGSSVRAACFRCDGTVMMDGKPLGQTVIGSGVHELTARTASGNVQRAFFRAADAPAIAIHLSSTASPAGTLVVETNVDGAAVSIDRRSLGRQTEGGRLVIALEPRDYTIEIRKQGYRVNPDRLVAKIRKGDQFRAAFRLDPDPGTVVLSGAPESATVLIDGRPAGTVRGGSFSLTVSPGAHTVGMAKEGFKSASTHRSFGPGETVRIDSAVLRLDPLPQPPQAPPRIAPQQPAQQLPQPSAEEIEAAEWAAVRSGRDRAVIQAFLQKHPARRQEAQGLLAQLEWDAIDRKDRPALERFAGRYRGTPLAQQAASEIARIEREAAAAATRAAEEQMAADRGEISRVLTVYAAAFERKDINLLKTVWLGLPEAALAQAFRGSGELRSQLRPLAPAELTGDRATVRCTRVTDQVTQFGRQKPLEEARTVRLRRESGRWVIYAID